MTTHLSPALAEVDPQVAEIVRREEERQETTLELIASENHVSTAVRAANGSVFTNKYAEGYPGKRYYGGCAQHGRDRGRSPASAPRSSSAARTPMSSRTRARRRTWRSSWRLLEPGDTFASRCSRTAGTSRTDEAQLLGHVVQHPSTTRCTTRGPPPSTSRSTTTRSSKLCAGAQAQADALRRTRRTAAVIDFAKASAPSPTSAAPS
jgi:hypothetical protein